MAKISKSSLKNAVKECLIEILQEGLTESVDLEVRQSNSLTESSRNMSRSKKVSPQPPRRSNVYDKMEIGHKNQQDNKINQVTSQMTDDPVLAGIFADTARTTMVEQLNADRHGTKGHPSPVMTNGDTAAKKAAESDPMSLFSESANNWAALAFSDQK